MALAPEDRDAIVEAISAGFGSINRPSTGGGSTTSTSGTSGGGDFKQVGTGVMKGLGGVATAAASAGNDLNLLAKGVGGVIAKVPLLGESLSLAGQAAVAYVEDTRGTFQSLSKVGASLNGELGEFRKGAADTRMPLDVFADMVGKNAGALSALGGGVSNGVKRFTELSDAMFKGDAAPINAFMALGMTIEESNEFLLDNMSMTRRSARLNGQTNDQAVASALALATQMSTVAKLTGKNAKEMQDEIKSRQRNGATQAALRLAEMRGATGAQEAYAASQAALEAGPPALQNLVDDLVQTGVPMSKATAQFASLNSEAYALAKQAAEATKRGDTSEAARLSEAAAAAANSSAVSERNLQVSTLAQISDVAQGQADTLEAVGDVVDAIAEHAQKMGISMETAEGRIAAFASLTKELEKETNSQVLLAQDSQTALAQMNEVQIEIANAFSTGNRELADKVFKGPNALTKIVDGIKEGLSAVNDALANADPDQATSIPGGSQSGEVYGKSPKGNYTGGTISPGQRYLVGERGPEIIQPDTSGSVLSNAQSNNAVTSANNSSEKGMEAVAKQLEINNSHLQQLVALNTKQVSQGDKQIKATKGAGNLMHGIG